VKILSKILKVLEMATKISFWSMQQENKKMELMSRGMREGELAGNTKHIKGHQKEGFKQGIDAYEFELNGDDSN
jgi:hypothetical protein